MQQEFSVPFRSGDGRLDHINIRPAQLLYSLPDFRNCSSLIAFIADDAARSHAFASHFKLRLHQDHDLSRLSGCYDCGEDECSRDKCNVHCDEICAGLETKLLAREITCVGLLQQLHSRIVAKFGIDLPASGVDGDETRCSVLQQAIREAAGGSANINAGLSADVDTPVFKPLFELQSAAADVAQVFAEQTDAGVIKNRSAGFFDFLLVY